MCPILFKWGSLRIGSYGLLLACAFLGAIFITNRQFRKFQADINLAWDIYLLAILGGLIGSRALFLIEVWPSFMKNPYETFFSGAGFSVIGGYLLAIFLCYYRVKKAGEKFWRMADICTPGLAIGYAIGRLGCITAGDGCYGIPSVLPWAMTFPNGLVPTLSAKNTQLVQLFKELFPNTPIPSDIPVHPTPLYESLSHFLLLFLLLKGDWNVGTGRRFAFFLGWFGISRFFVEFIRLNPKWWLGLTSDQWLSIGLMIASVIIVFYVPRLNQEKEKIEKEPAKSDSLP
ncbi:MAG: prolipoprotein diacylglyceryl transferase [Candidatus Riflebacteria bacterium]|nr:prolipoprotein diacylglyceryl transferase [Candidatus Riflebacteria bacterium]